MCCRCQNIYDCPAEDISKKQRGTELAIASAILLVQLPRILFHLLLKFSSVLFPAMKPFLSALLRKEPLFHHPAARWEKVSVSNSRAVPSPAFILRS